MLSRRAYRSRCGRGWNPECPLLSFGTPALRPNPLSIGEMQSLSLLEASEEQPSCSRTVAIPLELANELPLSCQVGLAFGHMPLRLG